jgi:hypothetical protein
MNDQYSLGCKSPNEPDDGESGSRWHGGRFFRDLLDATPALRHLIRSQTVPGTLSAFAHPS